MKIYLASVNLGDQPYPRILPHRLFSFFEISTKLFSADKVFKNLIEVNKQKKENQ